MIRKRIVGILGYIAFALAVAGVCVWYGFPYTAYVNARLAEVRSPFVTVIVGKAGPRLPLGMNTRSVNISCPGLPGMPGLLLDNVTVHVSPLSFVFQEWNAALDADFFGGTLGAKGTLSPRSTPRDLEGSVVFEDLGLKGISPCLKEVENISGTVDGTVAFTGRMDRMIQGEGNATVVLKNVAAVLSYPLVAGFSITNGSGDVQLRMHKGRVEILSCQFESTGIKGTLKGKIALRTPLAKSAMQLVVTLAADAAIKEQPAGISLFMRPGITHTLNISGTIERPSIKLLS